MSVFVRNRRFVVDYWPHGRKGKHIRKTLPASIASLEDAQAIERELRQAAKVPQQVEISKDRKVSDLFREYLDWYEIHRAPTTYRDIVGVYQNHLRQHLGDYLADDISIHHTNAYKQLRKGEGGTNPTINKELKYFSGFLRWAWRQGYCKKRDFEIEKLPYVRPVPVVLTHSEAVKLIKSAESYYRPLFLLLFSCGVRLREARLLRWENVDMNRKTIKILGKGGKENVLPMGDWLRKELTRIRGRKKSGWVFPSKQDETIPVRDVRKALARAKKKAGITKRVYSHLLRHSIATHLLESGVGLRQIQNILGHAQVSTTEFYTQVAVEVKREALSKAGVYKTQRKKRKRIRQKRSKP